MYFVIAGLSNIGKGLAGLLAKAGNEVVIVDPDEARCTEMATSSEVMVITGDATQKSNLEAARVRNANVLVAATGDDSDNLMICMLAKEMGAKKVISVVNDVVHVETFKEAGISFQVKPDAVVAGRIYHMILQPYVKDFFSFERAEIFGIEVEEGMKCVDKKVSEIGIPDGMKILVLERAGKYLDKDAKMEPKDWLTLIVNRESTKRGVDFMNRWFTKG